jgi:hypothetical protein
MALDLGQKEVKLRIFDVATKEVAACGPCLSRDLRCFGLLWPALTSGCQIARILPLAHDRVPRKAFLTAAPAASTSSATPPYIYHHAQTHRRKEAAESLREGLENRKYVHVC